MPAAPSTVAKVKLEPDTELVRSLLTRIDELERTVDQLVNHANGLTAGCAPRRPVEPSSAA